MQLNNLLERKSSPPPPPSDNTYVDMDDQIKLAHKVVDVVDRANRKICVTLLRYNVDKSESSYGQVQFFARKK